MPIRALKIPAEDEVPVRAVYVLPGVAADYVRHVGGPAEYVHLFDPEMFLVVDALGERRHRRPNRRATVLYWAHRPEMTGTPIYGDALLVGPPGPDGFDTDLAYGFNPWFPTLREDEE